MADERRSSPMEPKDARPGAPPHQDHFISQSADDRADRRNIRSAGSDDAPAHDPDLNRAQGGPSHDARHDRPDGQLHSQDPQLRRVHEHAHDPAADEKGRGSDMGEGQGGGRHNTQ